MENIGAILMKNDSISVIVLSYVQYASLSILPLVVKEWEPCGTRLPIDPLYGTCYLSGLLTKIFQLTLTDM